MSVQSLSSAASLAMVGISNANPSQLSSISATIKSTQADNSTSSSSTSSSDSSGKSTTSNGTTQYTPAQKRRIAELERVDADVHAHEEAHVAAGRSLILSGPNYDYVYGPDGKRYAVSGDVTIDVSPANKPQANIDKGERIQKTALAPRDPSQQDYSVAATGAELEARGRTDLRQEELQAQQGSTQVKAYSTSASTGNSLDTYA